MLQGTGPVDTQGIGILLKPGIQQGPRPVQKATLSGKVPGLGQMDQFQVPVWLPQVLDVPYYRFIAVIKRFTKIQWRHRARFRVLVPIRRESQFGLG